MERSYTDEELAHIDDHLGCTFEGRKYSAYEATQKQRSIERSIRKHKRLKAAYEAAGLEKEAENEGIRLQRLNQQYQAFSKAAGLPLQRERMRVDYLDDASVRAAEKLRPKVEAENSVRAAIRRGDYPLTINPEKQARHMAATATPGRSVITISLEELQEIVNARAGSGEIELTKSLDWKHQEVLDVGKEIGYTINAKGDIIKTTGIKIHYSKTGIHVVPYSGRGIK